MIIGRGFLATELDKRDIPGEGIFYFTGVSSNSKLATNFEDKIAEQMIDWVSLLGAVSLSKSYLIYASSATAEDKVTPYAKLKAIMEALVDLYDIKALGVRLPAVYGPGEAHKGTGASVIYQWCEQMSRGESPVIFGDGTQTRDFMYVDDAIDQVLNMAKEEKTGIISIGTGIKTSFNEIVEAINKELGTDIKPIYKEAPEAYIEEINCDQVSCETSLAEGIRKTLHEINQK